MLRMRDERATGVREEEGGEGGGVRVEHYPGRALQSKPIYTRYPNSN